MTVGVRRGVIGFTRSVASTAGFNIIATATAGGAGIIIARALGPTGRGEYAAIIAWFNVVLIVGELGQTAATTFFVAQNPQRAPAHLATARNMMITSGVMTLAIGILVAPVLAQGNSAIAWGYRLMFATCLAGFVGASYTFSLQGSNIRRWNLVRISQPTLFAVLVVALYVVHNLELRTTLVTLSITIVVQTAFAYGLCAKEGLTGGKADRALARPMTRYGLSQLAASIPIVVSAQLDQLVLSLAVAAASLAHYAVAVSLTRLAVPVVSAVGYVAFPRLASRALSRTGTAALKRRAVLASAGAGTALTLPLVCLAPWLVPAVFGAGYRDAVPLVWLLAPGGVFLACGQVGGDLLRGLGRPLAVAWAQGAAAVVTIILLITLLPFMGVSGAAIASSAGAGVALVFMMRSQRRLSAEAVVAAPRRTPSRQSSDSPELP